MRYPGRAAFAIAAVFTALASACAEPAREAPASKAVATVVADACVIGATGIGPIRLGMTLDEARRAFPAATFERSSDGDGVALVSVTRADTALMSLHALEDDAESPIDWSRTIVFIETFASACRTVDGVGPGAHIVDVERVLGPTRRIVLSEIESRQFIEFERQTPGVVLRLDYTGEFPPGARETTKYAPGARIFSVALSRVP